ncbi:MAG: S8 family serine peptidase [Oligoflexia bacterium]|nr:S8 family serine peptidase [Oligoflexia bacterium]
MSLTAVAGAGVFAASAFSSSYQPQGLAEHVPGQIVVKFRDAIGRNAQATVYSNLLNQLGSNSVLSVKPLVTDDDYQVIRLARDGDLKKAIRTLTQEKSVEIAEPNFIYRISDAGVPNDTDFAKTWGMKNTGQADSGGQEGIPGADVNVLPLWQQGFTGSRNVLVAVIDTGVQWDHPDLEANIFTNPGEAGELANNQKDDDNNGFVDDVHGWNFVNNTALSSDDHDHGTHVSGTIGGVGNNGTGVAGVNWEVSILPVKFLDASGGGTLQGAIDSINYARLMKAQIMSNSWGGGGYSAALEKAIEATRDAGIVFVAAAGNESNNNDSNPTYPATYPIENIISVAATDNRDGIASFSNYGARAVHVAAPGVKVYSTTKDGRYDTFSGTSMATPHVSGIAALLLSIHPEWSFEEIKTRLIRTSDPVAGLKRKVLAKGRVNTYNALNNIVPPSNEPDESLWKDEAMVVESEHPYKEKLNQEFVISHPGAKFIRVHFERIDVESRFDFVKVESMNGNVVEDISGVRSDYMTDYVEGDQLKIRLKTDNSVNAYGFKIDKIQYIE